MSQCVDPACVEISGQFPCKAEDEWKALTPEKALEMLKSVKIENAAFELITERIKAEIN